MNKKHEAVIGSLDWQGCDTCVYCDTEKGGCACYDLEWEYRCEYDSVICESYKERQTP